MEIGRLILGAALIVVFGWFLVKNIKRNGVAKALFSLDIILGLLAGLYLVISSVW
ncbi:MAG: hypothetical protein M3Y60_05580 [Bacteroidota bacterium]|nr:hypothetical protein [Bacteroidota bacterium]